MKRFKLLEKAQGKQNERFLFDLKRKSMENTVEFFQQYKLGLLLPFLDFQQLLQIEADCGRWW